MIKNQSSVWNNELTQQRAAVLSRIGDWLQNGTGGYDTTLEIASTNHAHLPPARD